MKKFFAILFLGLTLAMPAAPVFAQTPSAPPLDYSGFVKCDGVRARYIDPVTLKDNGPKEGEEDRQVNCDFAALMETIIKLINWMFIISIPVATALFAYGGLLYMTGKESNISTAKKIFTSAAIGFIIMITAWIVVRTIVDRLVKPTSGATTFIKQK